jgi:hypothetical protein
VDYIVAPFTEQGPNLYRPGDAFDGPAWTSIGECTPRADAPWLDHLIELGEPSPIDAGHPLGRYLGDGRLRALAIGERNTSLKVVENTFWDSETGANCQPMLVDGVTRCVGDTAYWPNLGGQYADSACTQFLPYCNTGACEQTLFFEWGEAESCSGEQSLTALRRLVARVSDPVYELDPDTNACIGPVDPFEAWTWEIVDPSEFVPVVRQW